MTADDDARKRRLEMTVAGLQARYGPRALRRLRPQTQAIPHVSTRFPPLDQALGSGGLSRGHITELVSVPSAGTTTLALNVVAQAQTEGLAVYLDIDQNFDPPYAAQLGVDLDRLVLIEPGSWREACAIMRDFVLAGHSSILVFDAPAHLFLRSHGHTESRQARTLAATLDRLISPLSQTRCVLLFLVTFMPGTAPLPSGQAIHAALSHYAAVRLVVYRLRWLYGQRDIRGYEAKVYIAKNKLAASAGPVSLAMTLAGAAGNGP